MNPWMMLLKKSIPVIYSVAINLVILFLVDKVTPTLNSELKNITTVNEEKKPEKVPLVLSQTTQYSTTRLTEEIKNNSKSASLLNSGEATSTVSNGNSQVSLPNTGEKVNKLAIAGMISLVLAGTFVKRRREN